MLTYPHLPLPGQSRSLDLGVGNFGPQSSIVGEIFGAGDLLRSVSGPTEADKPMIIELAVAAMEELIRMAQPMIIESFLLKKKIEERES